MTSLYVFLGFQKKGNLIPMKVIPTLFLSCVLCMWTDEKLKSKIVEPNSKTFALFFVSFFLFVCFTRFSSLATPRLFGSLSKYGKVRYLVSKQQMGSQELHRSSTKMGRDEMHYSALVIPKNR